MTGVTVDHLVASTIFITALLLFVNLYTQTLQTAILYQQNRHIALKAGDLLDSILLNPGYPYNWGETEEQLSLFGLQQFGESGYKLSSFALMRLSSLVGQPVEYPRGSGKYYNNVSFGFNGFLFIPLGNCITYDTAAKLLGVNGTYGFRLDIVPVVNVSISEYQTNPLKLKVEANGPGFPLSNASLSYYLYKTYKSGSDPQISLSSGTGKTNSAGVGYLNFTNINGQSDTYTIVVYARLSGLQGIGEYSHRTFTKGAGVMPFVVDYDKGTIYLAHSWDVKDQGTPVPDYKYNATFFALTEDFEFQRWLIANSTGALNYGSKNYGVTTLPVGHPGFLLISYLSGNDFGTTIMPWGIGTLSVSTVFGGNPSGHTWTATELREVTVDSMAYQAKITCWSLKGYQIWKS